MWSLRQGSEDLRSFSDEGLGVGGEGGAKPWAAGAINLAWSMAILKTCQH